MTKQEIGETIGFYIAIGLLGWALVSFFPLTWGTGTHNLLDV